MKFTSQRCCGIGRRPGRAASARRAEGQLRRHVGQGRLRAGGIVRRVHRHRRRPGRRVVRPTGRALRGSGVTTQEGLSVADRETWADCFVAAGASQCGYCSPGVVMKAEVLLVKKPEPTAGADRIGPGRAICAAARGTPRSSTRCGWRRVSGTASRCRTSTDSGRVGLPDGPLPGPRARARRQAVRQRHDRRPACCTAHSVSRTTHAPSCAPSTPAGRRPSAGRASRVLTAADGARRPGAGSSSPRTGRSSSATARRPATSATSSRWWPPHSVPRRARRRRWSRWTTTSSNRSPTPAAAMVPGAPQLHHHAPGNVLSVSEVKRGDVGRRARPGRARHHRDLPDAVHRARLPGA